MAKRPNGLHVYEDNEGQYRWRIFRGGRIVADSSEGYTRKADARRAAHSLKRWFETRKVGVFEVEDRKR